MLTHCHDVNSSHLRHAHTTTTHDTPITRRRVAVLQRTRGCNRFFFHQTRKNQKGAPRHASMRNRDHRRCCFGCVHENYCFFSPSLSTDVFRVEVPDGRCGKLQYPPPGLSRPLRIVSTPAFLGRYGVPVGRDGHRARAYSHGTRSSPLNGCRARHFTAYTSYIQNYTRSQFRLVSSSELR